MIEPKNAALAYLILRVGAGINLLMHGWVRIGSGFDGFHSWMMGLFAESGLPNFMIEGMSYLIPGAELVLGLALILGLKTRWALTLSGALMITLVFGMSLLQKWDIVGLQMIYLVIYFLLILFLNANRYSFDQQINGGTAKEVF